jgi:hypothetical protein
MSLRRWFSIFALVLATAAGLLVAGLLHSMRAVRQAGYAEASGDATVVLQDRGFMLHDTRCAVVVYGDSTADVGLDPRLIEAQTGLSACNIATNRPVVDTLGMMPVDEFLKHNPKPRLIVLQFGPETFYRGGDAWQHNGPMSPLAMLTRNRPRSEALMTMARHPAETVQFLLFLLQSEVFPRKVDRVRVKATFDRILRHAEVSHGQLDLGLPPIATCVGSPLKLYGPVDEAWIRELHRRYESQGIAVLVRASDVPPCDPQLATFQRDLAGKVDGDVEVMPVNLFVMGYRHTTQEGSQVETQGLIELMKLRHPELMQRTSAQ